MLGTVRGAAHFNQGGVGAINQNRAASIALRGISSAGIAFDKASERLSTGMRINRASDDPGLFVGVQKFRSEIAGVDAAIKNAVVARNNFDVAQSGLSHILDNLNALKQTALRALGGGIADADKSVLQDEADGLIADIDRIVQNTELGGNRILNGTGDFYTESTDKAFDEVHVKRMRFASNGEPRDFEIDITRLAERATLTTSIDFAGGTALVSGEPASMSISGLKGSHQVLVRDDTDAESLVAHINAAADGTGVYASSTVVNGAEAVINFSDIDTDLELSAGDTITIDVTVDGQLKQVTVTPTGDRDSDGNPEVTKDDLLQALNSANLGTFNIISAIDTTVVPNQQNMIVRHAGAADFTLNGVTNPGGTMNGGSALLALSSTGTEPSAARMYSEGAIDNSARTFDITVFSGGTASRLTINTASASAADLQTALDNIATVTSLGVGENGREILQFTAAAGVDAFQFEESTPGSTDARDLGLLSHSGGGKGLASKGMAVLALYSEDFGSDQQIGLRNAGPSHFTFSVLDEANPAQNGIAIQGGPIKAYGVDAMAAIDGKRVNGHGFKINFSESYASFSLDLAPRFGASSETNQVNRALNLNYSDPTQQSYFGYRPVSAIHGTGSHAITDLSDPEGTEFVNEGIIDRVNLSVHSSVPDSRARSGLGLQITGHAHTREFLGVRNFESEFLGGLPSTETLPNTANSKTVKGAGTISQIARSGTFNLEGDPRQVMGAIKIIDRAIEQVIEEQTKIGHFQVVTLDRSRNFLEAMRAELNSGLEDIAGIDPAMEITALARAQTQFDAVTSVLAQANSRPQTLLQLLR